MEEHRVTAHFTLTDENFGTRAERDAVHAAEERMDTLARQAGVGDVDGDEFGNGGVTIYAYGPDADALFSVIEPELRALPLRPAYVHLNHGDSTEPPTRIDL